MGIELNPYAPPPVPDSSTSQNRSDLRSRVSRSIWSYLLSFAIVLSFLGIELCVVRIMLSRNFLLAMFLGCIALMHIPLVHHGSPWRIRFAMSLAIPFAIVGAAMAIGGTYLTLQLPGIERFVNHPLSVPIFSLLAAAVGLAVGGNLGYRIVRSCLYSHS